MVGRNEEKIRILVRENVVNVGGKMNTRRSKEQEWVEK